jgi:hypothetical protein
MCPSNLNIILIRYCLKYVLLLAKIREVNVHRGSQGCPQIRRARRDITEMAVVRKSCHFLDMGTGSRESVKDCLQVSSILHRDDSQLIFFVYPHEERLVFVVEDTSTIGPVPIETYSLQESITLLEQKMILNELLSLLLSQFVKRIVCPS